MKRNPHEELARWRAKLGLTARQVAEILKCDHSYVVRLERGSRSPGRRIAIRIQQLTRIPVGAWDQA